MGQHAPGADTAAARLTLVTLDCRHFDIATSVGEPDAVVYSPAVLRLKGNGCQGRPASPVTSARGRSAPSSQD